MAVYDDFHGAIFTIQSALLHDSAIVREVVVIDNNPSSKHGGMLRDFCSSRPGVIKYVPYTEVNGTAMTRNQVFKHATSEVVVVCDPHVVFPTGSLAAVASYFAKNPASLDLVQGPLLYDDGKGISTHFDLSQWGAEMWGRWDTNTQAMTLGEPFEIPAQGLGAFSCRRVAWLGFNEQMKGFGGEEGYIHTKYRQAGHKALCIPKFLWWHRFGRPDGVPYPLARYDKVRNYCLGFNELGLDLQPVHKHFVGEGLVSEAQWAHFKKGDYPPDATPPPAASSGGGGCGACKKKAQTQVKSTAEWYAWAKNTSSDINEHVPTLRELAEGCDTVVELAVRSGVSTAGLLAGSPKTLLTFDQNDSPTTRLMGEAAKGVTNHHFLVADSLKVSIPECDLLFIDTKHTAEQVFGELSKHASQVRKRIAFHDTEIFGERGEDGGPGLMPAIRRFLQDNLEWTVIRHDKNNHGFTVISRDPKDRKELPATWRQGLTFLKAQTKHKLNGGKFLSLPMAEERIAVCSTCPERAGGNCSKCGCFLWQVGEDAPVKAGQPGKVWYPTETCPIGKWVARPTDGVDHTPEELAKIFNKEE